MTLSADREIVCLHDGKAVRAFDRKNGKDLWSATTPAVMKVHTGDAGPRFVLCEDRVLYSPQGRIFAYDRKNGEKIWEVKEKPRSGHFNPEDFFVIDDGIWVLQRSSRGAYTVYSLADGSEQKVLKNPISSFYIHQRCHPGRATRNYLLPPLMGIPVYDRQKDEWSNNHWIRGGCVYGIMPANGMIYAPPHACACYYQSKINGFAAVAPANAPCNPWSLEKRLVKGPAFGKVEGGKAAPAEWPVFRHDATRSSFVQTDVPTKVASSWKVDFGTRATQPVTADGRIYLSAIDRNTLYALDVSNGKESWRFIAGARIDSPPALFDGLVLFGCADGWIRALRATDGALVWKFCAAPNDRQMMAKGRPESAWPVSGSVLIQDGKLYAVAGRSMFLDGGMRMVILDPATGKLLSENIMGREAEGKDLQEYIIGKHMPVSQPDILSGDGTHVYMKSQTFTADGKRVRVAPQRPDIQYDREVHLFSPISFLDDSWQHRTYWIFGRAAGEGWAEFQLPPKRVPTGRILCVDEKNAYAYGRDPGLMCNSSVNEYRLYSAGKYPTRKVGIPRLEGKWPNPEHPNDDELAPKTVDWKKLSQNPPEKLSALDYNWLHEEPDVMARAMVLAGNRLFVAGPRDVVDEREMWGRSNEKVFHEKMREQTEWLEGKKGAVLQVFSKTDGKKLGEQELEKMPSFDGMIAADGCLYMVTIDGSLICFRGKE
jgi:outer membrane protein assembly factor BamB